MPAPFDAVLPELEIAPVLVVGAGPVGQTAALHMRRWGLPVRLLDARPCRDTVGSKAICQAQDVLDSWDAVGAGAIAAEGLAWRSARTYFGDTEISHWEFVDRGRSPFPACVNISQARTEEILDERLVAAGVATEWGADVCDIVQDCSGVSLRTAAGDALTGSYSVVAAGSRGDSMRRTLGVSFDGRAFDDRFLICDIRTELPGWECERRFYFDPAWNPGRQVLVHPCPGSVFRIDWQVPETFDAEARFADGTIDSMIRQIIGERPYEIVWRSLYRFQTRNVDRMRVGRVLLAGDVAHLVAPFGARGLNTGVADAENAAWKLAFHARGWGGEALLESYHAERQAAARENAAVTSATMRFLVPPDAASRAERRAALERAAAGAPAGIDSGRFSEPFWYVDSPLVTPDPRRPFAGRPDKGCTPPPAPGILLPDLPTEFGPRLRVLARAGILLICADQVRCSEAEAVARARTGLGCPIAALPARDLLDAEAIETLGIADDEVWVVRPDCYVAGIARSLTELAGVVTTALGLTDEGARHAVLPASR